MNTTDFDFNFQRCSIIQYKMETWQIGTHPVRLVQCHLTFFFTTLILFIDGDIVSTRMTSRSVWHKTILPSYYIYHHPFSTETTSIQHWVFFDTYKFSYTFLSERPLGLYTHNENCLTHGSLSQSLKFSSQNNLAL